MSRTFIVWGVARPVLCLGLSALVACAVAGEEGSTPDGSVARGQVVPEVPSDAPNATFSVVDCGQEGACDADPEAGDGADVESCSHLVSADVPSADTDGDGVGDCDACPDDADKREPGICGCGVVDGDGDGDGVEDCLDDCPDDSAKVSSGQCGCGVSDGDSDGDGIADCADDCPDDPVKLVPGQCGCGVADLDADRDGVLDCLETCPRDPDKIEAGVCGCGVADVDADHDGTLDCVDECPGHTDKSRPGVCGCGVPDLDRDGDGRLDCEDGCPDDGIKTAPGACGCGALERDDDGDGTADCHDACPDDPGKVEPGVCGCGRADLDADHNGLIDCGESCEPLPGLRRSRYSGVWEDVPDLVGRVPEQTSVVESIRVDDLPATGNFAVEFTGLLEVPESARYYFFLHANRGARLEIDGVSLKHVLYPALGGPVAVQLDAGPHSLRVVYVQQQRPGKLTLTYRVPLGGAWEPIPPAWLLHGCQV